MAQCQTNCLVKSSVWTKKLEVDNFFKARDLSSFPQRESNARNQGKHKWHIKECSNTIPIKTIYKDAFDEKVGKRLEALLFSWGVGIRNEWLGEMFLHFSLFSMDFLPNRPKNFVLSKPQKVTEIQRKHNTSLYLSVHNHHHNKKCHPSAAAK